MESEVVPTERRCDTFLNGKVRCVLTAHHNAVGSRCEYDPAEVRAAFPNWTEEFVQKACNGPAQPADTTCDGCYYCGRYGCPQVTGSPNRIDCKCVPCITQPVPQAHCPIHGLVDPSHCCPGNELGVAQPSVTAAVSVRCRKCGRPRTSPYDTINSYCKSDNDSYCEWVDVPVTATASEAVCDLNCPFDLPQGHRIKDHGEGVTSPLDPAGMSDKYRNQIADLAEYFRLRLPACGPLTLTPKQRSAGVDSLSGLHKGLVSSACTEWLLTRKYDLSYNQVCIAFFTALDNPAPTPAPEPTDDEIVAAIPDAIHVPGSMEGEREWNTLGNTPPKRIWIDPDDSTFWNSDNEGCVVGVVEYVRANLHQPSRLTTDGSLEPYHFTQDGADEWIVRKKGGTGLQTIAIININDSRDAEMYARQFAASGRPSRLTDAEKAEVASIEARLNADTEDEWRRLGGCARSDSADISRLLQLLVRKEKNSYERNRARITNAQTKSGG